MYCTVQLSSTYPHFNSHEFIVIFLIILLTKYLLILNVHCKVLLSSTYPRFSSHEFIVIFLIIYLPYLPVLMYIVQYFCGNETLPHKQYPVITPNVQFK